MSEVDIEHDQRVLTIPFKRPPNGVVLAAPESSLLVQIERPPGRPCLRAPDEDRRKLAQQATLAEALEDPVDLIVARHRFGRFDEEHAARVVLRRPDFPIGHREP